MGKSARLLGLAIYEIQEVWEGPDELCNKLTMPWGLYWKASNSSKQYPHQSPQRLWDWLAYTTQMPFAASMAWLTASGVGRGARMRGWLSTTFGQCTTGLAWCVQEMLQLPVNLIRHPLPLACQAELSTFRGGRPWVSQPHLSNCQQETSRVNLS